ncbi:O-antigen polymerase [Heyndrickxia sporothermodurans]|uniref:O-antigen polymerase n=1 Tax=Heyndrickxia sporothermodurans TaxID=46224 RepID=UPI002E212060|nr:O-antigen ligase [Heyndrickxia sporothermodurans]MED3697932.1 O-antigen ligase [Heyndrickxia sporothermodurans]
MGSFSIVIALFLMLFILIFEIVRKKEGVFDYLSFVNLVFFLLYVIVPVYMYLFNDNLSWHILKTTDIESTSFFSGELLALMFYFVMIVSYYLTNKLKITKKLKSSSSNLYGKVKDKDFFKVALILYIIGMFTWLVYMKSLGGYNEYMRLGELVRNDGSATQTSLAFFKHFNLLLTVSMLLFFCFIKNAKGLNKLAVLFFFVTSAIASFIILYQNGGRISLLVFIITLPVALMIRKNRINFLALTGFVALFILLVLFGDQFLKYGQEVNYAIPKSKIEILSSIIEEFAFPYNNLGNLIPLFPDHYDFRYGFVDLSGAIFQFIPSRVISLDFLNGETVSQFNTTLYNNYGQIPIDIVSFGYISFGIAGVIVLACVFGMFMKLIEALFIYKGSLISCVLYVAFLFQFSLAIIYGDPQQVFLSLFKYLFTLVLLFLIIKSPKKKVSWK